MNRRLVSIAALVFATFVATSCAEAEQIVTYIQSVTDDPNDPDVSRPVRIKREPVPQSIAEVPQCCVEPPDPNEPVIDPNAG